MSSVASDGYDFALNPAPEVRVLAVGDEAEPVMVVDGLMRSPAALVDYAAREVRFHPPPAGENFYPGLIGAIPLNYVSALVAALRPALEATFGLAGAVPARANCNYSMVTLAPERLNLAQRIPHVDTVDPLQIAILHYLCDERFDGTGFYRHRSTGFETLSSERDGVYHAALEADLARYPPPAAYIAGDTTVFQRTRRFDLRFDRVLVYRSRVLHSGQIDPAVGLSADPRRGRLTANIFLNYNRR